MPDPSGGPVVHDGLGSMVTDERDITDDRGAHAYDGFIGLRLLHEDPGGGEEHYLVRYPAGLTARWHRHSAAHTLLVLDGQLSVNGRIIGPGTYCHYPAGTPMRHEPAGEGGCLFLNLFHGPSDVEVLDGPGV